jgi:uncharacterized membrane protein
MRTHLILLCAAAVWCGAILAAPAALAADGPVHSAGTMIYAFFSTVCHQWDSHSFHAFGHKLPVCIRCSAIYFGFFAGVVLYPFIGAAIERRFGARTILAAAVAGMVIDVGCSMLGILDSSTASRLVTGGAFGILTAFVLTPVFYEIIASLRPGGTFPDHYH